MRTVVCAIAAILAIAAIPLERLSAQATTTVISGTVVDSSGVPASNVTVAIENVGTGQRRAVNTAADGTFRFNDVQVGRYRINSAAGRLGSSPSQEIEVGFDHANTVNVRLGQSGSTGTDAVVTAEPVPLSTRPAQLFADFNTPYVQYLPQPNFLARDGAANAAYNLSLLAPGVTSGSAYQVGQGPSVVGQRPLGNNFHIDGSDNNNRVTPGHLLYVSNEATTEFALFQNQSTPLFGHSTGGKFNSIVRSGTNEIHGAVYDYLQNRNLNAIDRSFGRLGITEHPRYDQNRLGASLGLPILPGKIFFFGNFEYIPFGFEGPQRAISYAPTAAGFDALAVTPGVSATNLGILRSTIGTVTPTPGLATRVGATTVPLGFVSTFSRGFQNQFAGTGSADWTASTSDQLRFRYVHNDIDAGTGGGLPAFATPYQRRALLASAAWYKTFTPSMTNELRLAYNRFTSEAQPSAVFPGSTSFPSISIQDVGVSLGPQYGLSRHAAVNTFQLADGFRWTIRNHTVQFGFDGRRSISAQSGFASGSGNYAYSNLARYLLDIAPDVMAERSFGSDYYSGNMWTLFPYVHDTWRVRTNLTVDAGLGWQYATIPSGIQQQALNAAASFPGALTFNNPETQFRNLAPRVGFAWSPQMSRQTVVRAGFGMAYDTLQGLQYLGPAAPQLGTTVRTDLRSNAAGFLAAGGIPSPYAPVPAGTIGLPVLAPATARDLTTTFYGPQQAPYTIQWNAAIQQALWRNLTGEVKYMGSRGTHLPRRARLNELSPVTPFSGLPVYLTPPTPATLNGLPTTLASLSAAPVRPLAGLGFPGPIDSVVNDGESTYHGLGLTLNQRFASGFQLLADYTWSHMIDDSTGTPLDIAFPRQRGNSLFDRRHRVSVTGLLDVAPLFRDTFSLVRNIFANVTLSGTYMYESAQFVPVLSGINAGLTGSPYGSAIFIPGATGTASSGVVPLTNAGGATVAYLATTPGAAFIRPGIGSYATGPRAALPLQAMNNWDVALVKRFSWRDRAAFEVRGEAYNLFNHAQYTGTNIQNLNGASLSSFPLFLTPGNFEFGNLAGAMTSHPRLLQVAVRATF